MNEILTALIGAFAGALFTYLFERRKLEAAKKSEIEEKKEREHLKKELVDIRSRAEGPFLADLNEHFTGLYVTLSGNVMKVFSPTCGSVLCWMREEVGNDVPDGAVIYHVLNVTGPGWRWVRAYLDDTKITFGREPEIPAARGLIFLAYHLNTEKIGIIQNVRIEFESVTGYVGKHLYQMPHGRRGIVRIHPPCSV